MYDPMVAKLIVWDADRERATARMLRALDEYEIEGLKTLIPFHKALLRDRAVGQGRDRARPDRGQEVAQGARVPEGREAGDDDAPEKVEHEYLVEVSGKRFDVKVDRRRRSPAAAARPRPARRRPGRGPSAASASPVAAAAGGDTLESPLQGNVWKVLVEQGQKVEEGQLVTIIEAMKMENEITAHKAGVIAELPIQEGGSVAAGDTLAVITSRRRGRGEQRRGLMPVDERRIASVALVLGALLFLVANLLHPKEFATGNEAAQLAKIAENYQRWQIAHLFTFAAILLFAGGRRRPRRAASGRATSALALAGGVLGIAGLHRR